MDDKEKLDAVRRFLQRELEWGDDYLDENERGRYNAARELADRIEFEPTPVSDH